MYLTAYLSLNNHDFPMVDEIYRDGFTYPSLNHLIKCNNFVLSLLKRIQQCIRRGISRIHNANTVYFARAAALAKLTRLSVVNS